MLVDANAEIADHVFADALLTLDLRDARPTGASMFSSTKCALRFLFMR